MPDGKGRVTSIITLYSYEGNYKNGLKEGNFIFKNQNKTYHIHYKGDMPSLSKSKEIPANKNLSKSEKQELGKYCNYSDLHNNGFVHKTRKLTEDLMEEVQVALDQKLKNIVSEPIYYRGMNSKDNITEKILDKHDRNLDRDMGLYIVEIPDHAFLALTDGEKVITINDKIDLINQVGLTTDPPNYISYNVKNFRNSGGPCINNAEAYLLIAAKYIIEDNNPTIDGCFDNISYNIEKLDKKNDEKNNIDFITDIYINYINSNISLEKSFYIGNTNVPSKQKAPTTVSSNTSDRSKAYKELRKKQNLNQVSVIKNKS